MKSTLLQDLSLAIRLGFDLTKLYLTKNNNELAYYNLLFSIACGAQPKLVVELGTGPGLSSLAFLRVLQYVQATQKQSTYLHSCDIDPLALGRIARYQPMVIPHLMPSDELAKKWRADPRSIDLLFIDALHTHEQALRDFENFSPHVQPGGLILMHDTHPLTPEHERIEYSGDVWRTALHIKHHWHRQFELVTYPHLCGISILRKQSDRYF